MRTESYRTNNHMNGGGDSKDAAVIQLDHFDTSQDGGLDKETAIEETLELTTRLQELQEMLFAQGKHRVLVVLQAIDGGGKDSTIESIFGPLNANGVTVTGFKVPSEQEMAHDYLWRVHPHVPGNGEIAVFNRSHYEEVLVVRVHDFVPKDRWEKRYQHICDFERMLIDEGTTVIKFLLLISKDEQKQRFQDRLDDPTKRWKFRLGDLEERKYWDDYQAAFQDMLDKTSDPAPWWVIPADRKWFRNRLIAQIMVEQLEALDLAYPESEEDLTGVTIT